MVSRLLPALLVAAAASGCGPAVPVEIDLCAPSSLLPSHRSAMEGADTWQVVVFGLRDDDIISEQSFAADRGGGGGGALLSVGDAVPASRDIRLLVRGYEPTPEGQSRVVAVASSPPLQLVGGDSVCLCVAPPEVYGEACYLQFCSYDPGSGCEF